MDYEHGSGLSAAVVRLLASLLRVSGTFTAYVEDRAASMRDAWNRELRRAASTMIYAVVAAFFICSAAAWASFALMLAFWESNRVLVASLLAGVFLLLAVIGVLLLRKGTR